MKTPYDEIFGILHRFNDPRSAFDELLAIGRARENSPIWDAIRTPDVQADIDAAVTWLRASIVPHRPTGIYLGIDTLNEDEGTGKNVEVGMTSLANPELTTMAWAWQCERYGEDHLVRGLYEVHSVYDEPDLEFAVQSLADYLFFFGYGGIVLVSALERLPVDWNSLFVWGFQTGDLAFLARCSPRGVTRLAVQAHQDRLIRVAAELGYFPDHFREIDDAEAARLAAEVELRFGDAANGAMTGWWHCTQPCTLPKASRCLHEGGAQCLTQIAPSPAAPVWFISQNWTSDTPRLIAFSGTAQAVQAVLENSHGFEYIVVGRELDWLFAEDHEHCLSVAGAEAVERLAAIDGASGIGS